MLKKTRRAVRSRFNFRRSRSILMALLILAITLSLGSGLYVGASFFAPLANVTITSTTFTTSTSWISSTILSTTTQVVQGVLTTIQYTSSTSTVTVTGTPRTAKTVTANGGAHITTAQSVFGGASGAFNGATAYLTTPDSPDWNFGTGDFTIDFWVRFASISGGTIPIYYQGVNDATRILIGIDGTAVWVLVQSGGNILVVFERASSPTITTNTWYHFALVRNGNNWYWFQNGTQLGTTYSNSSALGDFAAELDIGKQSTNYLNGWLDEFRVTKGVARWTSNFTLPTGPYASDGSTVLLLHMDGPEGSTTFTDTTT